MINSDDLALKGKLPEEKQKIAGMRKKFNEFDKEEQLGLIVWFIAEGGHLPQEIANGMAALQELCKTELTKREI